MSSLSHAVVMREEAIEGGQTDGWLADGEQTVSTVSLFYTIEFSRDTDSHLLRCAVSPAGLFSIFLFTQNCLLDKAV